MTKRLTTAVLFGTLMLAGAGSSAVAQSQGANTSGGGTIVLTPGTPTTRLEPVPQTARNKKKASGVSAMFKELRPGQCGSAPVRPPSSWPARGEAAVTVCQR